MKRGRCTVGRRLIAGLMGVILVLAVCLAPAPRAAYAASKKPAKVKGLTAAVRETSVTLTWKKAKRARKYQLALRTTTTGWKFWKTVKKTAKNKKKYSGASYKLKKSGSKYKVYRKKKVCKYTTVKKLTGLTYTYTGKAGETYVFVVRGLSGKKKGKWSAARTVKLPTAAQIEDQESAGVTNVNNPNAAGLMVADWRGGESSTTPAVDETSLPYLSKSSVSATNGIDNTLTLKNYSGKSKVTWKSSNTAQVKILSTSGTNGTTVKFQAVADSGTPTITATVDGKSYSAAIKCRPATKLSNKNFSLTKGYTTTVSLNNYYGTKDVSWSSSNTKVITVKSTSGTYKVKATLKAVAASGSATITCKAGSTSYTMKVTAKDVPSIKEGNLTLPVGATRQLTIQNYKGTPTWSSSKTSVATVSSKGLVTVKGTSGTTTITAKCGSKKATVTITARKKTPAEATTYEKKSYKYGGKVMIKAEVPKGWKFSVVGIDANGCDPIIMISDSTGKYGVYYTITTVAVKNKEAQDYWKKYQNLDLFYPIPVKGYAKNGYDAAGLFAGMVSHYGFKSYAVEKKLSGQTFLKSDMLVTRGTDKKGNKLRFVFFGQVHDMGSYPVYLKGQTLSKTVTTAASAKEFDAWFLLCQDVGYMQAPYNDLEDWAPVLGHVLGSIEFTNDCVKYKEKVSGEYMAEMTAMNDAFDKMSEDMVNKFLTYINS